MHECREVWWTDIQFLACFDFNWKFFLQWVYVGHCFCVRNPNKSNQTYNYISVLLVSCFYKRSFDLLFDIIWPISARRNVRKFQLSNMSLTCLIVCPKNNNDTAVDIISNMVLEYKKSLRSIHNLTQAKHSIDNKFYELNREQSNKAFLWSTNTLSIN